MFHNDRSQVITLLKRVKSETVFKHQLPFYKIPTVLKLLQMFFLNTPFLPKKECISMTTDFEKKRKSEGKSQNYLKMHKPSSFQLWRKKRCFPNGVGARERAGIKYSTRRNLWFRTLLHKESGEE